MWHVVHPLCFWLAGLCVSAKATVCGLTCCLNCLHISLSPWLCCCRNGTPRRVSAGAFCGRHMQCDCCFFVLPIFISASIVLLTCICEPNVWTVVFICLLVFHSDACCCCLCDDVEQCSPVNNAQEAFRSNGDVLVLHLPFHETNTL